MFFYMPAVIGSSILLTLSLIKQKQNPLISRKWLVLPALVFIYEMLTDQYSWASR
jgi:hypothetical protein